jgi:hypothetical protein
VVLPWAVLYVIFVFVYLILTPKVASPPVLDKGTGSEVNEKVNSPSSSATSDSEAVQKQLLESSERREYAQSSVLSRRSYSHATRHSW